MKEINSIDEIKQMVDSFYAKVRKDDLLGPIFNELLDNRWDMHLEKMYTFWETLLLGRHTYFGSPFPPHAKMPINEKHFERWIQIFRQNLDEQFVGDVKDEAIWRAEKMAQMFNYKIDYIKKNNL